MFPGLGEILRNGLTLIATSLLKSDKAVSSDTYVHTSSNIHTNTQAHKCPKENATGRTEDQKCYIPKKDSETGTLL